MVAVLHRAQVLRHDAAGIVVGRRHGAGAVAIQYQAIAVSCNSRHVPHGFTRAGLDALGDYGIIGNARNAAGTALAVHLAGIAASQNLALPTQGAHNPTAVGAVAAREVGGLDVAGIGAIRNGGAVLAPGRYTAGIVHAHDQAGVGAFVNHAGCVVAGNAACGRRHGSHNLAAVLAVQHIAVPILTHNAAGEGESVRAVIQIHLRTVNAAADHSAPFYAANNAAGRMAGPLSDHASGDAASLDAPPGAEAHDAAQQHPAHVAIQLQLHVAGAVHHAAAVIVAQDSPGEYRLLEVMEHADFLKDGLQAQIFNDALAVAKEAYVLTSPIQPGLLLPHVHPQAGNAVAVAVKDAGKGSGLAADGEPALAVIVKLPALGKVRPGQRQIRRQLEMGVQVLPHQVQLSRRRNQVGVFRRAVAAPKAAAPGSQDARRHGKRKRQHQQAGQKSLCSVCTHPFIPPKNRIHLPHNCPGAGAFYNYSTQRPFLQS